MILFNRVEKNRHLKLPLTVFSCCLDVRTVSFKQADLMPVLLKQANGVGAHRGFATTPTAILVIDLQNTQLGFRRATLPLANNS